MAEIRFHPEAEAEYLVSLAWYHDQSPQAAGRFESEIERILRLIAANPGLFPRYDDGHRFALLNHYRFSLVYLVQGDAITIVAVAHSRRSTGYWRSRS